LEVERKRSIWEIDIVDENGYDEDNFEGINYMKVELDLIVGEDPI